MIRFSFVFFFQAEDGIRDIGVTGVQTCALPILSIQLPKNTEAQIRPRSGLAIKNSITVLNTPGTIDEGYRGEICIIIINHGKNSFKIEEAMKIAQMVIKPVYKVLVEQAEDLEDRSEERRVGKECRSRW